MGPVERMVRRLVQKRKARAMGDIAYGIDWAIGQDSTAITEARRLPGGEILISNSRMLGHAAPVGAGQMTLWCPDGRIHRGWIGIGGNAKQRRRIRRESQRAGYLVEMHAR